MPSFVRSAWIRAMAGKLAAFNALRTLINPVRHSWTVRRLPITISHHPRTTPLSICSVKEMAGNAENGGLQDVEGPSPKLQKVLHHKSNGTSDDGPIFRVKRLSEKAVLPSRASPLSAGFDLSSAADVKVPARGKALVPTDLSICIPPGTYARIAPRSGLAWKHAIDVGAGVIDADYRGAVGVVLFNHSEKDFEVKARDRIAQLIVQVIVTPEVVEVEELDNTARGTGGFGSTGV